MYSEKLSRNGIGLYVCEQIVKAITAHYGLKMRKAKELRSALPLHLCQIIKTVRMTKRKILVCDDDDGILDMLSLVLNNKGYDVTTEIHSISIYNKIEEIKPDLLLLDLWMPRLNGEEILKTLKKNQHTKALPIVVMSASRDGAEIAKRSGADDYLEKPFDIKNLMIKIQAYVHS